MVSRLSDTFPFSLLVDAICAILIFWWLVKDRFNNL
jgi:hypothetical protein